MNRRTAWWQIAVTGIVIGSLFITCLVHPVHDFSDSERRPLASFPTADTSSLFSGKFMTDFETYTLDQFPLRDTFRQLKAAVSKYAFLQTDNNGLYERDGVVTKVEYPLNEDAVSYACTTFEDVYTQYLAETDCTVYLSLIPDKNAFFADDGKHLSMDYEAFYQQIQDGMPFATYIDIARFLDGEDYYATDSHWRQEAIADVALQLAQSMGTSLPDQYTKVTVDTPFYGVYYGQYSLPLQADTMRYLTNDTLESLRVFDGQNNRDIPLYDVSKAAGRDGYELFVGGSLSLVTIENPQSTNPNELVVFRDSFGSSIAPLLAQGYRKVTLVDIRYIPHISLGSFLSFADQDVLFLYSTSVLNNSYTLK